MAIDVDFRTFSGSKGLSCLSTVGLFQGEKLQREKQLVRGVAEFLLLSQIPGFVSMFVILLTFIVYSLLLLVVLLSRLKL